ncbi:MAG: lipid A export permease/ATP-binding protein MsbA [Gammaproteobacteria bacterium]|nr:lipid A export permease/ATP-binding protein MsbA [Gammaproteobacteria bacterium]
MQRSSNSSPSSWQTYRRLLSYVRPVLFALALGVLGNIGFAAVDAAMVALLKPLLDEGFIAHSKEVFKNLPLYVLGIVLLRGATAFLSSYFMEYAGNKVVLSMRQDLFGHLVYLPTTFYDNNTSGLLLSKLTYNTAQIAQACTDALKTLIREGATVVFLLGLMFYHSWKLTLIFMTVGPAILLVIQYASQKFRKLSRKIQDTVGNITHHAEETLTGNRVVKIFTNQEKEIINFNSLLSKNFKQNMKVVVTKAISTPAVQLLVTMVLAIIIYLASNQSLQTSISAGTFVSMIVALMSITHPLKRLTEVNHALQSGIAAAESVFAVLDEEKEKDTGTLILRGIHKEMSYQQVGFEYKSNHKKVLSHISFSAKRGEMIAFVGRSGSGKTTLLSLLPRLYDGYTGEIFIDGVEIQHYTLDSLRQQLSLVSQQVTLFNDTIANNIAYGSRKSISQQELRQVAEASYVMEFVHALPKGLDTLIGDNGIMLSGGQRQRIAIARALLKNAPILILDEATSSLDTESERHIQMAISELSKNRTTLVIAHRLSTVEKADRIIVLDKGQKVEEGTHSQLLAQNSHYAKLYRIQFQEVEEVTS